MGVYLKTTHENTVAFQATVETERALTDTYGQEVGRIVADFKMQWQSLATFQDPESRWELATEPFFNESDFNWWLWYIKQAKETNVLKSVHIRHVRVLEYTPERFKAVITLDKIEDRIALPEATVLYADMALVDCGVYVFVRDDGKWKLSASFYTYANSDAALERAWDLYTPDEVKQVIGELPHGNLCEW
jgi:hypothetical protein